MTAKIKTVHFITRTAILLALTIVFQSIGRAIPLGQFNQFITGSLVNACLVIAAAATGIWGSGCCPAGTLRGYSDRRRRAAALCPGYSHWQFYTCLDVCID